VSAQIGHAGPVADARSNRLPALAPTKRMSPLTGRFTQAATEDDISRITEAHADAAGFAADSGFDAVEMHFGHNYLISSFLSPKLNRRRDGWGGSLDNRARFARQVAEAVRARVGQRIAVTAKLNMDDGVPGGFGVEESVQVAKLLEADGHLDALELTAGSSLANPMYLFRGDAPIKEFAAVFPQPLRTGIRLFGARFLRTYPYEPAFLLPQARLFREALTMTLILLGGITDRTAMDLAMGEGFEFVAMGRALLMEPDLIARIREEPATKSLCTHCNRCMPTIYRGTRCVLVEQPG
jgi:2,4-dienoyl-CoA reductase-like NADH-dependent reductase (Old Yellow Enzyme family)